SSTAHSLFVRCRRDARQETLDTHHRTNVGVTLLPKVSSQSTTFSTAGAVTTWSMPEAEKFVPVKAPSLIAIEKASSTPKIPPTVATPHLPWSGLAPESMPMWAVTKYVPVLLRVGPGLPVAVEN